MSVTTVSIKANKKRVTGYVALNNTSKVLAIVYLNELMVLGKDAVNDKLLAKIETKARHKFGIKSVVMKDKFIAKISNNECVLTLHGTPVIWDVLFNDNVTTGVMSY